MEDERMICGDKEEQEMTKEQTGGQVDTRAWPHYVVTPVYDDNVMEVEESQQTDRREQHSVQPTPGEEQLALLGQVEHKKKNPPRSLQSSRAKLTPKMSLELRRKDERRARMSSSRALDTFTTTPQPGPSQ